MIPEEKSAAVTRGLREAFGVTEFEDIRRITKGQTQALVFRVVVRGTPYLLRMNMWKNSIIGSEREFTCMRIAAEAGLAPRVHYTSVEDRVSITDFVEEAPLAARGIALPWLCRVGSIRNDERPRANREAWVLAAMRHRALVQLLHALLQLRFSGGAAACA